jgi:hypothetical protein
MKSAKSSLLDSTTTIFNASTSHLFCAFDGAKRVTLDFRSGNVLTASEISSVPYVVPPFMLTGVIDSTFQAPVIPFGSMRMFEE